MPTAHSGAARSEPHRLPVLITLEPRPEPARSLSEKAYYLLRDQIITLQLKPGALLEESVLMAELQLGRTPIREALKRLALENLVTVVPHRGTFVSEINITDLARISEVRLQLEGYAARLAARRATQEERRVMARLQEELEQLQEGAGPDELIRVDQHVHRHIYRATHNAFLEETLDRYFNLSLRLWFLVLDRVLRLKEAVEEHRELLGAIIAGDGERAEAVMRRHITGFEAEIRELL